MRRLVREAHRRAPLERAQHRDQGHCHHQRHRNGNGHRQGLVAEQLPGNTLHEDQGQEHRNRGQGGRDHRHADFTGTGNGGFKDAQPALTCFGNRFQHHDGVIHHQPGGQRQATQRHHVQAQAQLPHDEEGGDDRHRQRQRNHERAPAIAQEQEDDQDRQDAAQHTIKFHAVDGIADEDRLVFNGGQLHPARQFFANLLELCFQRIGGGHGIGIAFLVQRQFHRFTTIQTNDGFAFLVALAHLGHIFQANGLDTGGIIASTLRQRRHHAGIAAGCGHPHRLLGAAIAAGRRTRGEQHVANFIDIGKLVHRAHQIALRTFFQAPAGDVHVFLLQALDHVVDGQPQLRQFALVHIHLHFIFQAAADLHRSDASHRFELAFEIFIRVAAQLHQLPNLIRTAAGLFGR